MIARRSVNIYSWVDDKKTSSSREDDFAFNFGLLCNVLIPIMYIVQILMNFLSLIFYRINTFDRSRTCDYEHPRKKILFCRTNRQFHTVLVVHTFNSTMSFPLKTHDDWTRTSKSKISNKKNDVIDSFFDDILMGEKRCNNLCLISCYIQSIDW